MPKYKNGQAVSSLPFNIPRTPDIMEKYLKAWLVFVFFSIFLATTTALMLATNPCAGQAAVVLGWATLAIYVFVFIGVLISTMRPRWVIPIIEENLYWIKSGNPLIQDPVVNPPAPVIVQQPPENMLPEEYVDF